MQIVRCFFVKGQIRSFKIMELNLFVCFYCQLYFKRTFSHLKSRNFISLCAFFSGGGVGGSLMMEQKRNVTPSSYRF